jgi:hypothetical protein
MPSSAASSETKMVVQTSGLRLRQARRLHPQRGFRRVPVLLSSLTVACPNCGSRDITYSCEPKCCFNHLCGNCYATFELLTIPLGKKIDDLQAPSRERDCLAPTTACALCESLDLFQLDEGEVLSDKLFCASCHALLKLQFDAVESK